MSPLVGSRWPAQLGSERVNQKVELTYRAVVAPDIPLPPGPPGSPGKPSSLWRSPAHHTPVVDTGAGVGTWPLP